MGKKTRYVILGLLRDESMAGYEIKKCIDTRMSFFWQESYGQLYPELRRLLEEGSIKEAESSESNSKREKIRYEITDKGLYNFNQWMKEENETDSVRSEGMLKFFLATDDNKQEIINHLEKAYEEHSKTLELFHKFEKQLSDNIEVHNNHKYILEVVKIGRKEQELYCEWSKEYLEKLSEGKK